MNRAEEKYNNIDLWKFIMAFAVVAIHTGPLKNTGSETAQKIYTVLVSMAVPFFFMASGYLLASKMEGDYGAKDLYRIEHQLYKTVKMYLFWTLVY
jgi:peptidoglycan/LPS O-acetylase OafA/YrhL